MKINASSRGREHGYTTIVVLTVLGIMVMLLAANTVALNWLRREVNLVESRQTQHWTPPTAVSPPAR